MQTHPEITLENAKSFVPRFPLSKVKRIAKMDDDCGIVSNAVAVTTAFAAELFVQSFVENALAMNVLNHGRDNSKKTKSTRLTYGDLVDVVNKQEGFMFLEDALPKNAPQSASNSAPKKKKKDNTEEDDDEETANTTTEIKEQNTSNKQHTLSFFRYQANAPKAAETAKNVDDEDEDVDMDAADNADENEEDEEQDEVSQQVQEQLSQVEQMDHVVDVDQQEKSASQKERMILNRNQEDNNDMMASSDSEPDEGDISQNDDDSDAA